MTSAPSSPADLPLVYRITMLYIEPVLAFFGAYMAAFQPRYLLASLSPSSTYREEDSQFVFDQLSGSWLYFAFVETVVLRSVLHDGPIGLRVWRLLAAGMLLSDALNIYGSAVAMAAVDGAGWTRIANAWAWTPSEWFNVVSSIGPALLRVALVAGAGVAQAPKRKRG